MGLQKYLVGHKILSVDVKVNKIFQGNVKNIIGAKIVDIKRVGKGLIIELNNNYVLAIHLKLTGQVIYSGKDVGKVSLSDKTGGNLPSKYTHVIFDFADGSHLYFNDLRQFGFMQIVDRAELDRVLAAFGPEPLLSSFRPAHVQRALHGRTTALKNVLLNQALIAGLGNIYADEACFMAGLRPTRPARPWVD